MEFHPVQQSNGVVGSADATKVPCPDSVLYGWHRKLYDGEDNNKKLSAYSTPYTHINGHPNDLYCPFTYHLNDQQIKSFHRDGVLVIPGTDIWTEDEKKLIINSVNEMNEWKDTPGKWMKYYEKKTDDLGNKILARVENFTQYHSGLDHLLNGSKIISLCGQLFDEEAILYKEKINYKMPGGEGFQPHQDVAAGWWMYGQSFHISALIAVDNAYPENGCLEVVYGAHNKGVLGEPWKEIDPHHVSSMEWRYVPTQPGDVVFFDSYVPHRSGNNLTDKPRRVLYATYAKKSEGDFRTQYYADKRLSFPPDIERLHGHKYEYKI